MQVNAATADGLAAAARQVSRALMHPDPDHLSLRSSPQSSPHIPVLRSRCWAFREPLQFSVISPSLSLPPSLALSPHAMLQSTLLAALLLLAAAAGGAAAQSRISAVPLGAQQELGWNASVTVELANKKEISSVLYGIFFEEVGGRRA